MPDTISNHFSIFEEELSELRSKDLYRECRILESSNGIKASWNGKEIILFCGNDYLGLSRHPKVIRALQDAAAQRGCGSGASRLISGTSLEHARLEEKIAAFKRKERALVFTAGYLANLGVLTALAHPKDLIVMDKLCHASLIDGARLSGAEARVFPHKNYGRAGALLESNKNHRKKILVSDTVFSMDGDLADLYRLVELKKKYDCLLIVDDAHGTGVLGPEGRGALEAAGLEKEIDVCIGTLSKAVGCLGGFAAASETIIEYLINGSRPFIFATSLPPAICAAASAALEVIEKEPEHRCRLWKNAQVLHQGLTDIGFSLGPLESPILPIIIGAESAALRASQALLEKGFWLPAVRRPTVPKGKARLRVTVSAAHQEADLQRLLKALTGLKKD